MSEMFGMPLHSFSSLVMSLIALVIVVYTDIVRPWLEAKPKLTYVTTPHFVPPDTAVNGFLITNRGKAPAKNIGLYIALLEGFTIKEITSNLEYKIIEGGIGQGRVKIVWEQLPPKNSIDVGVFSKADPAIVRSIVPKEFRLWHEDGIVDEIMY